MKVQPQHLEHMRTALTNVHSSAELAKYREAGFSDKRYRWDMARNAKLIPFICDTLYEYCNDVHIDTALRKLTDT